MAAPTSGRNRSIYIHDPTTSEILMSDALRIVSDNISTLANSTGNFSSDDSDVESEDYVPYNLRPETYIIPVLFAIIFIIGVLGNGTLIVIFLKHRTMRNVPNMYIISLATGDLLVICCCVPFVATVYTFESWPYGLFICKFSEFIKDVSIGVSVFTLTALSADRYFAIVDPMRKLQGRRATRITCISIVGIWIVSLVFAVPSLVTSFIWTIVDESNNHTYDVCYPFPEELGKTYPKVVVMCKFLAYYAIPLGFIATFYIVMARHLLLSTRNMPGEAPGQAKQIQSRKKVAKMVMAFVVIFALCFFPSHVFLIWFYYNPNSERDFNNFWHIVRIVGFCLSFINSCLNPITLYCVSGTFRKHFNRHLFCCCCRNEVRSRGLRGVPGYSTTQTEHLYADRMSRNGTQISRASTAITSHHQVRRSPQQQQQWNYSESHHGASKFTKQPLLSSSCSAAREKKLDSLALPSENYPLTHMSSSGPMNVSSSVGAGHDAKTYNGIEEEMTMGM